MLREDAAGLALDPNDSNRIYAVGNVSAGSFFAMGVFRSTNGGASWSSTKVHNEAGSSGRVVAIDPTDTRTIYAGGETNAEAPLLYRSLDGGSTWTKMSGPFTKGIRAVAVNPQASGEIYVGSGNGLWRSKNGGASWSTCPGISSALAIALNEDLPNQVFVGGEKGVFFSRNKGASWTPVGAGLKVKTITSLFYHSALRTLFAGTDGGGLCAREF